MKRKLMKAALVVGMLAGVGVTTSSTEAAYVLCHSRNGDSCTTPGTSFLCYNHYPDEPGLCECTSSYVYECS
jgi:hypothetical protein